MVRVRVKEKKKAVKKVAKTKTVEPKKDLNDLNINIDYSDVERKRIELVENIVDTISDGIEVLSNGLRFLDKEPQRMNIAFGPGNYTMNNMNVGCSKRPKDPRFEIDLRQARSIDGKENKEHPWMKE